MVTAKDLWEMPLHDTVKSGPFEICRVPGGWIYMQGNGASSVFVPLDNEMVERESEARTRAIAHKDNF